MRNTHVSGRAVLAVAGLAAAALAAVLMLSASAGAAGKASGKTILTPKTATLDALAAEGVTVDVAPDASLGNKGIKFPITGGRLSLDNLNGKIKHSGGLTFTGNGVTLTLGDFIVKTGRKNVLRASIDGTDAKIRLAVLNLNRSRLRTRGGRAVVSNVKVLVARRAGRALAATFGVSNYTGAKLGTAEIKITQ
ncbi:MAG TPA: hypothetical protein VD765_03705 [Solirubrobacterales bacterium]|nr:hypothetical protein [Solirubrobacterales bacterium]